MKKLLFVAVLFTLTGNIYSQNYPSFDEIEKFVTDSSQITFYPVLIERFNNFDASLTFYEHILIYYGYGFQENYNGYRRDPSSAYYDLFKKGKYEELLLSCDEALEKTPVCISSNLYKGKALKELYPDSVVYNQYLKRAFTLIDVLFNSGDGKSMETAYKVLFLSDERRIMYGHLDLEGYTKQALINHYDELTVKKSKKFKQTKIYFDVYLPLSGMSRQFRKTNG